VSTTHQGVFERARTPAEPGPGPLSWASLRALDLAIGRRVGGLLAGDYNSAFVGVGTELHQVREYQPGDDVRRIEWNTTARTGTPHVRVELAERVLVTWLVVDLSASMALGTAERRKIDVAEGVAIAMGHVATRRGDRLGVVTFGGKRPQVVPPRRGRLGLLRALEAAREAPGGSGRVADALAMVHSVATERAFVAVISDFRGPHDWQRGLLGVSSRHATMAIEIRDRREDELEDVGELRLLDPETGRQVLVDTADAGLRKRFADAAREERQEVTRALSASGARHVVLSTSGDWLLSLGTFMRHKEAR